MTEIVLTSWTVDDETWREFAANVHRHLKAQPTIACVLTSLDQPAPHPLQVVVYPDTILVGDERLDLKLTDCNEPHLRDGWLEFLCDNDHSAPRFFPIPVPAAARENAAWVVYYFRHASIERSRRLAEVHAPTFSNRLLKLVEANFILVLLLLFFVVIPGAAMLIAFFESLWTAGPR